MLSNGAPGARPCQPGCNHTGLKERTVRNAGNKRRLRRELVKEKLTGDVGQL